MCMDLTGVYSDKAQVVVIDGHVSLLVCRVMSLA